MTCTPTGDILVIVIFCILLIGGIAWALIDKYS